MIKLKLTMDEAKFLYDILTTSESIFKEMKLPLPLVDKAKRLGIKLEIAIVDGVFEENKI